MNLSEKEEIIRQGKSKLEKSVFPENILMSIKESRLRKDISDKIFSNSKNYQKLSPQEQKESLRKLSVRQAFDDFHKGFGMFRTGGIILSILGFISLISSYLGLNSNFWIGVITLLIGLVILGASMSNELVKKYTLHIGVIYLIVFAAELLLFAVPDPFIFDADKDILASRRSAILKIANEATPIVYLTIKSTVGFLFFFIHLKQRKYLKEKVIFEKGG